MCIAPRWRKRHVASLGDAFRELLRFEGDACRAPVDVSVVCDPIERSADSPTHVTNPRIVVEVLSPTTERYDREQKRLYYQELPSLREYVLVAQDRRRIEVWRRSGEGWEQAIYEAGAKALLRSIDFEIDVDELYEIAGVNVR